MIGTTLGTQGIYVVTTEDRWPCKIGISDNMVQRLDALQTGAWKHLAVADFWFPYTNLRADGVTIDSRANPERMNTARIAAQALERAVHRRLKEFDLHLKGEWFDITAHEAVQVVRKVAEKDGFRLVHPRDIALMNTAGITRPDDIVALQEMLRVANSALEALTKAQ